MMNVDYVLASNLLGALTLSLGIFGFVFLKGMAALFGFANAAPSPPPTSSSLSTKNATFYLNFKAGRDILVAATYFICAHQLYESEVRTMMAAQSFCVLIDAFLVWGYGEKEHSYGHAMGALVIAALAFQGLNIP